MIISLHQVGSWRSGAVIATQDSTSAAESRDKCRATVKAKMQSLQHMNDLRVPSRQHHYQVERICRRRPVLPYELIKVMQSVKRPHSLLQDLLQANGCSSDHSYEATEAWAGVMLTLYATQSLNIAQTAAYTNHFEVKENAKLPSGKLEKAKTGDKALDCKTAVCKGHLDGMLWEELPPRN